MAKKARKKATARKAKKKKRAKTTTRRRAKTAAKKRTAVKSKSKAKRKTAVKRSAARKAPARTAAAPKPMPMMSRPAAPAPKAEPTTFGEKVSGAYHAVVDTVKETDELRDKMEPRGVSESS